jgi:hypothetical protein
MVVPDSSPRAFVEMMEKFLKGWKYLLRPFFPSSGCNVPWGRASAPAGPLWLSPTSGSSEMVVGAEGASP